MSDVAKTPRGELECKKKYLYEYTMFWECNDGCKCQILEDDVVDLLNEQEQKIQLLEKVNEDLQEVNKENQRLHEENVKQCERWKNLYDKKMNGNEEMSEDLLKQISELKEENQELKRLIKRMGELGGFNKHMIKTICGD